MSAESRRLEDLVRFYRILDCIEAKTGVRQLSACDSRMDWPSRGVYFFKEPGE